MQSSIYNSIFGAMAQEQRLNIITNNLANVNTAGYKKDKLAFEDMLLKYRYTYLNPKTSLRDNVKWPEPDLVSQPRLALALTDFSSGTLQKTGNDLDMAIQGPGFFKVQTPDGTFYSRNGQFKLSTEGQLLTGQGYQVLGQGGAVEIPAGTRNIQVGDDGQISADGTVIDVLDVVSVSDTTLLEKRGEHLFQSRLGTQVEEVPLEGAVVQGFLESSNVEVVEEMVRMIETMRAFEAYQKVIRGTDEEDKKLIQRVGSAR